MPRKYPFYGFAQWYNILTDTEGNQCALNNGYAPCQLEVMRQAPDWEACFYNTNEQVLSQFANFQVFPKELRPKDARERAGITFQEWLEFLKK